MSQTDSAPPADIMRRIPRELTQLDVEAMERIKKAGEALWLELHALEQKAVNEGRVIVRELEHAKKGAEEAVMWGVKHVTG